MSTRLMPRWLPHLSVRAPATVLPSVLLAHALSAGMAQAEKPRRVTLAYYGYNAIEPGARLGYEAVFFTRGIQELFIAGGIGFHSGPSVGYSVLTQLELGYRATAPFGLFFDGRLGIGYINWSRPAQTGSGSLAGVVINEESNTSLLNPTALAGLGWDWQRTRRWGVSLFVLGGPSGRYDFAGTFAVGGVLLAGLGYHFGAMRESRAPMPVSAVPPAEAPTFPDDPGAQAPGRPLGPAEPVPFEPTTQPPVPVSPLAPTLPADVPQLPPPPTVPYTPRPGGA